LHADPANPIKAFCNQSQESIVGAAVAVQAANLVAVQLSTQRGFESARHKVTPMRNQFTRPGGQVKHAAG
jgi:hypothetical protein